MLKRGSWVISSETKRKQMTWLYLCPHCLCRTLDSVLNWLSKLTIPLCNNKVALGGGIGNKLFSIFSEPLISSALIGVVSFLYSTRIIEVNILAYNFKHHIFIGVYILLLSFRVKDLLWDRRSADDRRPGFSLVSRVSWYLNPNS